MQQVHPYDRMLLRPNLNLNSFLWPLKYHTSPADWKLWKVCFVLLPSRLCLNHWTGSWEAFVDSSSLLTDVNKKLLYQQHLDRARIEHVHSLSSTRVTRSTNFNQQGLLFRQHLHQASRQVYRWKEHFHENTFSIQCLDAISSYSSCASLDTSTLQEISKY